MCMADAREGYKRVWGPMEVRGDVRSPGLELLMVVSHMWALGTKPRSSGGVSCKLFLNAELSLAPPPPFISSPVESHEFCLQNRQGMLVVFCSSLRWE